MSSKISFILSLVFVVTFMLFGVDLICLQYAYSDLDAKAVTIGYLVSKNGRVDDSFINKIETKYNVNFTYLNATELLFGDAVDFVLSREFDPLVLSNDVMTISVKRSAIIGYYG